MLGDHVGEKATVLQPEKNGAGLLPFHTAHTAGCWSAVGMEALVSLFFFFFFMPPFVLSPGACEGCLASHSSSDGHSSPHPSIPSHVVSSPSLASTPLSLCAFSLFQDLSGYHRWPSLHRPHPLCSCKHTRLALCLPPSSPSLSPSPVETSSADL